MCFVLDSNAIAAATAAAADVAADSQNFGHYYSPIVSAELAASVRDAVTDWGL